MERLFFNDAPTRARVELRYESVINLSFSALNTGPKRAHERALDEECTRYRGEAFADTTRTT